MGTLLCRAALAGAIHAFLPLELTAQDPPTLKLVRDLRIDAAEHDLSPITFVAVAPNGNIAVGQHQDGLIRFFDATGLPLGSFGRPGQGPGEFGRVGRGTWVGDTLVANEVISRRFTFISPDLKLVRVKLWPTLTLSEAGAGAPRFSSPLIWAPYPNGDFLVSAGLARESPVPDLPGATRSGTPWIRVDSTGRFKHVIAWSSNDDCGVPIQEGRGSVQIPFCSTSRFEVSPDAARLAFVRADRSSRTFRVSVFRASGDTAFHRSYAYRPIPLTKSDRDQAIASAPPFPGAAEALEKARFPEHRAPVSRILAGRDETTWLELATASGDRTWNVLDAMGTLIGRVRLKRNVQATVVSRDLLWATETDDDGLQHIVRYRVTR